jgi:mannitol-1-phosphate/altronate dehydrogenase
VREIAWRYITDDVIPTLTPSPIDLPRYRDVVLERFRNAALADTNERVASDSYAKLQRFVAPTVCERLDRGQSIESVARLPALYLAVLQRWEHGTLPFCYEDQSVGAQRRRDAVGRAGKFPGASGRGGAGLRRALAPPGDYSTRCPRCSCTCPCVSSKRT